MKRKIINLSVATSVFCTSIIGTTASAASFGNTVDYGTYGATFTGKVHNDGDSIMYAVGGKYTLKMTPPRPQAWFNVQPPSVSMGCAGMSFKGMFGSLLNISQIGDQLKDAGAAFAWGIILGLVTSLPGIKEVFDTINKWANQIQSLLANACNIGKKLAGMTGIREATENAFEDGWNDFKASHSFVGEMQNSAGSVTKTIGDALTNANEWASSTDTAEDKEAAVFKIVKNIFNNPGYISNTINTNARENNQKITDYITGFNTITQANPKIYFYEAGTLSVATNPTGLNTGQTLNWKVKMLTGIIASNLVGKTGITNEYILLTKDILETLTKAVRSGGVTPQAAQSIIDEWQKNIRTAEDAKIVVGAKLQASDLEQWLVYGTFPTDKLYMSEIVAIASPAKSTGSPKVFFLDAADQNKQLSPTDNDWGTVFANFGNVRDLASKQIGCVTRDTNLLGTMSASDCAKLPPVLMPSVSRYMLIYSQSAPEDQEKVKDLLIQYVSGKWADTILQAVTSSIPGVLAQANAGSTIASAPGGASEPGAPTPNISAKPLSTGLNLLEFNNEVEKVKKSISDLRKEIGVDKDTMEMIETRVETTFTELNVRNKTRGILSSPK